MTENAPKKRFFYGWVVVAALCLVQAIVVVLVQNYASFFQVPISETLGVTYATYSIESVFGSIAGMLFSALLSKKMGQGNMRMWMTVCALVSAAACLGHSFINAIWQLYALRFVLNFAMAGLTFLPINTLMARWFDDKKAFATSIVYAAAGVGGMIFSPILSNMIATVGWRESYMFIAGMVLAIGIVVFLLVRSDPSDVDQTILRKENDAEAAEGAAATPYAVKGLTRAEALKTLPYWMLIIGVFCGGLLASSIAAQLPTYAIEQGVNYAIVMVFYSAATILCKFVLGVVFDKLGIAVGTWTIAIAVAGCCICLLLVPLFGLVPACVAAVLLGFNSTASFVAPLTNGKLFGYRFFAENYGYINVAFMLGCMFGSPLAAGIRTATGSYELAWIVLAVVSAILLICTLTALSKGKNLPQRWHE